MKLILGVAAVFCILAGCSNMQITGCSQEPVSNNLSALPTADMIKSYNSGEVKNLERFQQFTEKIVGQERDHIRIIHYTTEGDPIYYDLNFNGEEIAFTVDSSQDQYGSGEMAEVICTELAAAESIEGMDYFLDGCEHAERQFILSVSDINE